MKSWRTSKFFSHLVKQLKQQHWEHCTSLNKLDCAIATIDLKIKMASKKTSYFLPTHMSSSATKWQRDASVHFDTIVDAEKRGPGEWYSSAAWRQQTSLLLYFLGQRYLHDHAWFQLLNSNLLNSKFNRISTVDFNWNQQLLISTAGAV